jgi:hypothetical protein
MYRTSFVRTFAAAALATAGLVGCTSAQQTTQPKAMLSQSAANMASMTTSMFKGAKVNGGTVSFSHQGDQIILTWSDDFKIPDTPAPHWQVVDSKGNIYLLQRLKIKGDKENKSIVLPAYIKDVAKVQVWCSFAEALLGEASFASPLM